MDHGDPDKNDDHDHAGVVMNDHNDRHTMPAGPFDKWGKCGREKREDEINRGLRKQLGK